MISSKDSAKASSPPASRAERSIGKVTSRKVVKVPAPRSIDASSRLPPIRRSRACTLLNTVTMQKVACATTMVVKPELEVEDRAEGVVQRQPGHDAGQRDRQDDQQRDGVAPEEPGSLQGQRGHRAQHQRHRGGQQGHLHADPQRVPAPLGTARRATTTAGSGPAAARRRCRLVLNEFSTTRPSGQVDHGQHRDGERDQGEAQATGQDHGALTGSPTPRYGVRRPGRPASPRPARWPPQPRRAGCSRPRRCRRRRCRASGWSPRRS